MMPKKIFVLSLAAAIFISTIIYVVLRANGQQIASTKYRELPSTKFLFAEPPTILSINWATANKITIQGVNFSEKNQPIYIGDISSGTVSPLLISGKEIFGHSPTISPNGEYLAFAWDGIRIIQIEGSDSERQLAYTSLDLAWSHSSRYLAFTTIDQARLKISIYDLEKDQTQMIFEMPQTNVSRSLCCALAWSADDQKIAIALTQESENSKSSQSDIYILFLKNNQLVNVTNTPTANEEFPAWSPKEDILLFTSNSNGAPENNEELVIARGDGLCQMKIQSIHGINSPTWSPDGTKIAFITEGGVYDFGISSIKNEFNSFRKTCNITK